MASVVREAVGEAVNLGNGVNTRIRELALLTASILGTDITIGLDPARSRPYDVDELICDYSKACRILCWEIGISQCDSLRKTPEWLKQNKVEFEQPLKGWSRHYVMASSSEGRLWRYIL